MDKVIKAESREQWLIDGAEYIMNDIILPVCPDQKKPPYKVSLGFPFNGGKNVIGCCHPRSHSQDGYNEIFIRPDCDDSLRVLGVLAHELIHATDDCQSGHKNFFAKTARAIGLTGKLTATTESPELIERLNVFILQAGHIPHSKMLAKRTKKKQSTRMLKLECGSCGFTARTSNKWLEQLEPDAVCPACGEHDLNAE